MNIDELALKIADETDKALCLLPSVVPERNDAWVKEFARRFAAELFKEPVAWGIPNTRPTERCPLMGVMLELGNAQYPELLIPLFRAPEDKP